MVGWIGLICIRPRYQGRGIGRAPTREIVGRLEERGCRALVLTATDAGRSIYEKMGFTMETLYHGFSGSGLGPEKPSGARRMPPEDLAAVCDLDRRMICEDRSHLLRRLAGPGWVVAGGGGEVRGYHLRAVGRRPGPGFRPRRRPDARARRSNPGRR